MRKVYVSCAMTHVSASAFSEYSSLVREIGAVLAKEFACDVKYALKDSDPQLEEYPSESRPALCYAWDRKMVQESDLVVAEVSFPAIGVGHELQMAAERGIPIVLLYRVDGYERKAEEKPYIGEDQKPHKVQIGNGVVSIMAQGNPSVVAEIAYVGRDDCIEKLRAYLMSKGGVKSVRNPR